MSTGVEASMGQITGEVKPPLPRNSGPIVIIGAGTIVHDAHLPAYRKARFPVAAIVDMATDKAAALAQQYSVPFSSGSLAEILTKIPKHFIFDLTIPAGASLKALPGIPDGSAVLIQKPVGETLNEAVEILKLCKKKRITAAATMALHCPM